VNQTAKTGAWTVLRPLTRKKKDGAPYVREAGTERQIRALLALSEPARRARLALRDRSHADFVGEEALVYCLRTYQGAGETATAWRLAECLFERVTGHVRRHIERWRLGPDDADDCVRDLFAALLEAVFDDSPAGEFWEVRFWVCLDRRLWNLLEKRQAAADLTQTGEAGANNDEAGEARENPLLRVADPKLGPAARAELGEALALLTENERLAVYLCRVEGWPEESDDPARPSAARVLGVTGRSVRNYLKRAENKLHAWEQDK
jgi:DNA-directed RNA polymerase specialized sigma24 family protein